MYLNGPPAAAAGEIAIMIRIGIKIFDFFMIGQIADGGYGMQGEKCNIWTCFIFFIGIF